MEQTYQALADAAGRKLQQRRHALAQIGVGRGTEGAHFRCTGVPNGRYSEQSV